MNKLLSSQRGLTLIELLLAVVITAIVSVVIYSVFITGVNLYQKIQIEGQLRDDADYIATLIMNEMYENSPKLVEEYSSNGENGVKMIRSAEKKVESYIIEDDTDNDSIINVYFKDEKLYIHRVKENQTFEIETPSSKINSASSISLGDNGSCIEDTSKRCISGTIKLILKLESNSGVSGSLIKREPLVLESTFGF